VNLVIVLASLMFPVEGGSTFPSAFSRFVAEILKHEGGEVYDAHDPGGHTKFGISQRSYPELDIANLTLAEARAIYYRDFWLAHNLASLPDPIAFMVFDFAVHAGPTRAIRALQSLVEVEVDGKIGPATITAVQEALAASQGRLLGAYTEARRDYHRRLSIYLRYANGWDSRVHRVHYLASVFFANFS
jgi:lysozyme family protein